MDRWWEGEGFGTIREGRGAKERGGKRGNGIRNGSRGEGWGKRDGSMGRKREGGDK